MAKDIYAGIANLLLEKEEYDLGDGILLRKTYAHLMAPFTMAFEKPLKAGGIHPGPWQTIGGGGIAFDLDAELFIPGSLSEGEPPEVIAALLLLIRLWINPAATVMVLSGVPLKNLPGEALNVAQVMAGQAQERVFPIGAVDNVVTEKSLVWIKDHWKTAAKLARDSNEFMLAVEALHSGQFVHNTGLTMISIWGALEALFFVDRGELRFRISVILAAFLEPYGPARNKKHKEILKLYDKRSAAAHGKPNHQSDDLLNSFVLLRSVLLKIIALGVVPTRESTEAMLLG